MRILVGLRASLATLLLVLSSQSIAQEGDNSAELLLAKMSQSLRELSYSGVFTFEHGGMLETLRVVHQVAEDQSENEWLEYLNGPERAVQRVGLHTACVTSSERLARGQFAQAGVPFYGLSQHYHFYLKGEQRIAGRLAKVLHIVPRDEYRHGYTLFLDAETALPLMSMTINGRRRVLERMQFTELNVGPAAEMPVTMIAKKTQAERQSCQVLTENPASWRARWVPSGFVLTAFNRDDIKGESLSYTDGLTTFSIFKQPMTESLSYQGSAQRGASVVVMKRAMLNGAAHLISVVGELPVVAADRIAQSVAIHSEAVAAPLPTGG